MRLLLPVSNPKDNESHALRAAACNGHVECVRLLMTASEPLGEIDGLLKQVFDAGQAKMAALLIEEEPRLLDGVDVSKCLAVALEKGQKDMAGLLSSIIDKRELMDVAPDAPACGGRIWPARL